MDAAIAANEKQAEAFWQLRDSIAPAERAIGPAIGGGLLNNAIDQVDSNTIQRTFWTASAIMIIAIFIAVYFSKMERRRALA